MSCCCAGLIFFSRYKIFFPVIFRAAVDDRDLFKNFIPENKLKGLSSIGPSAERELAALVFIQRIYFRPPQYCDDLCGFATGIPAGTAVFHVLLYCLFEKVSGNEETSTPYLRISETATRSNFREALRALNSFVKRTKRGRKGFASWNCFPTSKPRLRMVYFSSSPPMAQQPKTRKARI